MFLAREIQRAREAKGMSRDALAKAVFVSESLVRSWERGKRLPKPDHLKNVERVLGFGNGEEPGILCRLREELVKAAVPVEWFGRWQEIEEQATSLWTFQPLLIPGLLQTEEYATVVLRAANHIADLDESVTARMERQRVLTGEDPPMLIALITEVALRHNVGGPKVMHDQLMHLADMAERDNIIVHIIPDDSPVCAGFLSGFVIANFDGGDDVAYVDNQLNGEVIEDAEDVVRLRRMFDTFRADTLRRQESIDFIRRVAAELWTK
jgi:transcriptional regulator with XRE-family HTH domain